MARKESGGGAMPATGWDGRFDRVIGTLNLPPGHRLLAAIGADAAPARGGSTGACGMCSACCSSWASCTGPPASFPRRSPRSRLVLTYQEAPEYIWLWGNLLAALAIARAAPEGRFQKFARGYRTLSFAVLGLALLPFLWLQSLRAVSAARAQHARVRHSTCEHGCRDPYGRSTGGRGPSLIDLSAVMKPLRRRRDAAAAAGNGDARRCHRGRGHRRSFPTLNVSESLQANAGSFETK